MNPIQLSVDAELCIAAMHLRQDQVSQVRATITKYAIPEGLCAKLGWGIYRIINFIKAIFGCSDWQIAKKIIQARAIDLLDVSFVKNSEQTLDQQFDVFQRRVKAITDLLASELLRLCLGINEGKIEIYPINRKGSTLAHHIDEMDIEKALGKIKALRFSPGVIIGNVRYFEPEY